MWMVIMTGSLSATVAGQKPARDLADSFAAFAFSVSCPKDFFIDSSTSKASIDA
jgi:hypothetical protein